MYWFFHTSTWICHRCTYVPNLPWFMDLRFQVPMQYCSLQIRSLLPSLVTSMAGHCFHFGSISSFFLELFLHSSPVSYSAPREFIFHIICFCIFILLTGFSKQDYWCLYTSNEISEREIKETTTFTIARKRVKYLGIEKFFKLSLLLVNYCLTAATVPFICH